MVHRRRGYIGVRLSAAPETCSVVDSIGGSNSESAPQCWGKDPPPFLVSGPQNGEALKSPSCITHELCSALSGLERRLLWRPSRPTASASESQQRACEAHGWGKQPVVWKQSLKALHHMSSAAVPWQSKFVRHSRRTQARHAVHDTQQLLVQCDESNGCRGRPAAAASTPRTHRTGRRKHRHQRRD